MDMIVDVRSVVFASLCVLGLVSVFLAWTWRAQRLGNALGWWSAAFTLATLDALSLLLASDALAPFEQLDETIFILAAFALWFGFRSLNRQPLPLVPAAGVVALFLLVAIGGGLSPRTTHIVSVVIACGIVALMVRDTLLRGDGGKSWRVAAMALVGIHGTILAIRAALDDGEPLRNVVAVETLRQVFFMLEPMLMPMALGYVFLVLAYDRQHRDALAETIRDPLTGLLNRRGLDRWIAAAAGRAPLQVVMIDIDHFKAINDSHGHDAGDRVIIEVAARLTAHARSTDALARVGGEEFCLVMAAASPAAARDTAERMRRAIEAAPVAICEGSVPVAASFGLAEMEPPYDDAAAMLALKAADGALYAAKRGGRNRVTAASESSSAQPGEADAAGTMDRRVSSST